LGPAAGLAVAVGVAGAVAFALGRLAVGRARGEETVEGPWGRSVVVGRETDGGMG